VSALPNLLFEGQRFGFILLGYCYRSCSHSIRFPRFNIV
jgi:hypothetical protein